MVTARLMMGRGFLGNPKALSEGSDDPNIRVNGGPYRNRTYNQWIKSPLLCLVELTAHIAWKNGVDDGTRTHDGWIHNPGLYQLSYAHH